MSRQRTYQVIADDGQEYGPITETELKAWIREGRVNWKNQAWRNDGSGVPVWQPLGVYLDELVPSIPNAAGELEKMLVYKKPSQPQKEAKSEFLVNLYGVIFVVAVAGYVVVHVTDFFFPQLGLNGDKEADNPAAESHAAVSEPRHKPVPVATPQPTVAPSSQPSTARSGSNAELRKQRQAVVTVGTLYGQQIAGVVETAGQVLANTYKSAKNPAYERAPHLLVDVVDRNYDVFTKYLRDMREMAEDGQYNEILNEAYLSQADSQMEKHLVNAYEGCRRAQRFISRYYGRVRTTPEEKIEQMRSFVQEGPQEMAALVHSLAPIR